MYLELHPTYIGLTADLHRAYIKFMSVLLLTDIRLTSDLCQTYLRLTSDLCQTYLLDTIKFSVIYQVNFKAWFITRFIAKTSLVTVDREINNIF